MSTGIFRGRTRSRRRRATYVAFGIGLTPGPGSVVLTGSAPTVTTGITLTPGTGAVQFSGLAPQVTQGELVLTPGPGSLVMTGQAPAISAGSPIFPGTGTGVADVWMAAATAPSQPDSTEEAATIEDVWMSRASITAQDAAGTVGMPIINAPNSPYPANTTPIMQMVIRDPYGNGIPASAFSALTLTLADTATGAIVNSVSQVNILNTGRGTIDASGNLQIILEAGDTSMAEVPGQAQIQRSAIIDWTWSVTGAQPSSGTGRQQINFIVQALAGP